MHYSSRSFLSKSAFVLDHFPHLPVRLCKVQAFVSSMLLTNSSASQRMQHFQQAYRKEKQDTNAIILKLLSISHGAGIDPQETGAVAGSPDPITLPEGEALHQISFS